MFLKRRLLLNIATGNKISVFFNFLIYIKMVRQDMEYFCIIIIK
jgi:hypothetical protein